MEWSKYEIKLFSLLETKSNLINAATTKLAFFLWGETLWLQLNAKITKLVPVWDTFGVWLLSDNNYCDNFESFFIEVARGYTSKFLACLTFFCDKKNHRDWQQFKSHSEASDKCKESESRAKKKCVFGRRRRHYFGCKVWHASTCARL